MFFHKIVKKNKSIVALAFSFCFFPTFSMSIDSPQPEAGEERGAKKLLELKTAQEMINYGEILYDLCKKERYQDAFNKAFPKPILKVDPLAKAAHEGYSYYRLISLAMIYISFGKNSVINQQEAMKYYQKAERSIEKYLQSWGELVILVSNEYVMDSLIYQSILEFKDRLTDHRAIAFKKRSEAASISAHLILKNTQEQAKKKFSSAIEFQKKSLEFIEESPKLKNNQSLVLGGKYSLFNDCLSMINLCDSDQEKKPFLEEIKEIHRFFKRQEPNPENNFFLKKMSKSLEILKKMQEKDFLSRRSRGTGKIATAIQKKARHLDLEITTEIKEVASYEGKREFSSSDILLEHQNFCAFAQADLQSSAIRIALKGIEEKIRNQLIILNRASSLADVYEMYGNAIGSENLVNDIISFGFVTFLLSGNVEEALERINIISDLEYRQKNNNSILTRFLRASIKNMNGDHKEWEDFEQEIIAMREKAKEKKKRQKKRRREAYVEAAKQSQEEAFHEETRRRLASENDKQTPHSQASAISIGDADVYSIEAPVILPDLLSQKEAKREKIERHVAVQKQRAEAKEEISSFSVFQSSIMALDPFEIGETEEKGKAENQLLSLSTVNQSLSSHIEEFYPLKGITKKVNEEIEQGTWRISRENLIAYFEALGCTAKEGGKHKKISLPKAILIYHEGNIISILNDLGGALTLPRWDKSERNGEVPAYLRKQILIARKKLLFF